NMGPTPFKLGRILAPWEMDRQHRYRTTLVGEQLQQTTTNMVRNRSRKRPGRFVEMTRLLAQAVPYQIDPSRTIWNVVWQATGYRLRFLYRNIKTAIPSIDDPAQAAIDFSFFVLHVRAKR